MFIRAVQAAEMRLAALLPLLLLAACEPIVATAVLAGNVATIPLFGRSAPDMIYSGVTGKDCSIVRVEAGNTYCREAEAKPAAPMFCTRSLGTVDCWAGTEGQPGRRGVADGPMKLTPAQEAHRTRGWPGWFRD